MLNEEMRRGPKGTKMQRHFKNRFTVTIKKQKSFDQNQSIRIGIKIGV